MPFAHPVDFRTIDMESGWERPEGYAEGVWAKPLNDTLDETTHTGHRTCCSAMIERRGPAGC